MAKFSATKQIESGVFKGLEANQVQTVVNFAVKGYGKARENLHFAACAAVAHAMEHGNVTPLADMLTAMGNRSQTRHRLAAWIRHHCVYEEDGKKKTRLNVTINKDNSVNVKIADIETRKLIPIDTMFSEPYWDVIDVQETKAGWEMEAALLRLLGQAIKNGKTEEDVTTAVHKLFGKAEEKAAHKLFGKAEEKAA